MIFFDTLFIYFIFFIYLHILISKYGNHPGALSKGGKISSGAMFLDRENLMFLGMEVPRVKDLASLPAVRELIPFDGPCP